MTIVTKRASSTNYLQTAYLSPRFGQLHGFFGRVTKDSREIHWTKDGVVVVTGMRTLSLPVTTTTRHDLYWRFGRKNLNKNGSWICTLTTMTGEGEGPDDNWSIRRVQSQFMVVNIRHKNRFNDFETRTYFTPIIMNWMCRQHDYLLYYYMSQWILSNS